MMDLKVCVFSITCGIVVIFSLDQPSTVQGIPVLHRPSGQSTQSDHNRTSSVSPEDKRPAGDDVHLPDTASEGQSQGHSPNSETESEGHRSAGAFERDDDGDGGLSERSNAAAEQNEGGSVIISNGQGDIDAEVEGHSQSHQRDSEVHTIDGNNSLNSATSSEYLFEELPLEGSIEKRNGDGSENNQAPIVVHSHGERVESPGVETELGGTDEDIEGTDEDHANEREPASNGHGHGEGTEGLGRRRDLGSGGIAEPAHVDHGSRDTGPDVDDRDHVRRQPTTRSTPSLTTLLQPTTTTRRSAASALDANHLPPVLGNPSRPQQPSPSTVEVTRLGSSTSSSVGGRNPQAGATEAPPVLQTLSPSTAADLHMQTTGARPIITTVRLSPISSTTSRTAMVEDHPGIAHPPGLENTRAPLTTPLTITPVHRQDGSTGESSAEPTVDQSVRSTRAPVSTSTTMRVVQPAIPHTDSPTETSPDGVSEEQRDSHDEHAHTTQESVRVTTVDVAEPALPHTDAPSIIRPVVIPSNHTSSTSSSTTATTPASTVSTPTSTITSPFSTTPSASVIQNTSTTLVSPSLSASPSSTPSASLNISASEDSLSPTNAGAAEQDGPPTTETGGTTITKPTEKAVDVGESTTTTFLTTSSSSTFSTTASSGDGVGDSSSRTSQSEERASSGRSSSTASSTSARRLSSSTPTLSSLPQTTEGLQQHNSMTATTHTQSTTRSTVVDSNVDDHTEEMGPLKKVTETDEREHIVTSPSSRPSTDHTPATTNRRTTPSTTRRASASGTTMPTSAPSSTARPARSTALPSEQSSISTRASSTLDSRTKVITTSSIPLTTNPVTAGATTNPVTSTKLTNPVVTSPVTATTTTTTTKLTNPVTTIPVTATTTSTTTTTKVTNPVVTSPVTAAVTNTTPRLLTTTATITSPLNTATVTTERLTRARTTHTPTSGTSPLYRSTSSFSSSTTLAAVPASPSSTSTLPVAVGRSGPVYIEIKLQMTWRDFCDNEDTFRLELVNIVRQDIQQQDTFTIDQIRIMESPRKACALRSRDGNMYEEEEIEIQLYLVNKSHHYDVMLTYVCAGILKQGFQLNEESMFKDRLIFVRLLELTEQEGMDTPTPATVLDGDSDNSDDAFINTPGVTIVIAIAVVGGVCCAALILIQVFLRRRFREGVRVFNRTYSVTSVDSIALSNVTKSRPNSGLFNPGLDLAPERITDSASHLLNLTELSNFALSLQAVYTEFQKIPNKTPRLSVVPIGAEDKNRFANILPVPSTRVRLEKNEGDDVATYINANYVSGYNGQKHSYIATQAPLDSTVGDFWTMVWQQETTAIVMLINPEQDGHKKCGTYFPESAGPECAVVCGEFSVMMTKRDVHQEYITSWLQVKSLKTKETRCVRHFWLTCWPVGGRPEPISLVRFVLDSRPQYEDSGAPLVVHCCNGTARTGVFLALDICMRQYEDRRTVDVMKCVNSIRQERAGCVQTSEQYAILYQALSEYAVIVSSPGVSASSSATTLSAIPSS